jgi:PAS domain S-box-containing protein
VNFFATIDPAAATPIAIVLLLAGATAVHAVLQHWRLSGERARLREAESELRAANSTYRSLIDNVTELIYVQELETGRFLDVNEAVVRAYGYSRDEIVGRTPELLAEPARVDLEETATRFAEAAAGTPQRFEWWGRTRAGTTFPKEVVLVRGEWFGRPVIIAVARDISERLAARESIRVRTEEYREIFEGDLVANFVGLPDGSLDACNDAFRRMAGYETMDQALAGGVPPLAVPGGPWREIVDMLTESGRIEARELDLRQRGGRVLRVLLYARSVNRDGQQVRFYGHCLDITEQRALADRVREAQKLEAVGLLAGGVAHDFNNALTTVQGHAELLLEGLQDGDPVWEGLREIRESAERAGRLTRKLLAFSRRRVLRPRTIDMASLVRDARSILEQLLGEDVELVMQVEDGAGAVKADPGEVEQLLINLALNSREALPRGGRVEVRVREVQVPGWAEGSDRLEPGTYAILQVVDDGIGIDERIQGRVFEPFFTTKTDAEGQGLGLATAYGIVQEAGGDIWVRSAPGHGATFTICFPCVDSAAPDGPAHTEPRPDSPLDVLLAEDEDGVRRLARTILEKEGYRVHEAPDGRSALELAPRIPGRIGLLVTDVVMPGLRGTELADRLQARDPGLRVLFMSGYTEAEQLRDEALEPGQAFLAKPFSPADLRKAVRDVLRTPVHAGG